jgi:hypothetical protein
MIEQAHFEEIYQRDHNRAINATSEFLEGMILHIRGLFKLTPQAFWTLRVIEYRAYKDELSERAKILEREFIHESVGYDS